MLLNKTQIQTRVVLENLQPAIDNGEFSIRRIAGEKVNLTIDVLCDGHDFLRAEVQYKHNKSKDYIFIPLTASGNDAYWGEFTVEKQGIYEYQVNAWVDYALNWLYGARKKIEAGVNIQSELTELPEYISLALEQNKLEPTPFISKLLELLKNPNANYDPVCQEIVKPELEMFFFQSPTKQFMASTQVFRAYVERSKAAFSTWYEFFPRSSAEKGHGTFKDCLNILPKIAKMGFDTLYFPPIHPIGEVNRKGKNNATQAAPNDDGSCWAIGSKHGGHTSIHPKLGTLKDFKKVIEVANELGIEIAMDYALQAAPDHPWVKENSSWFKWRPDGTVQYAENPPKKYQDILPIYFESTDWKKFWKEAIDTLQFWIQQGIKVFRVDNPHTKPFHFWGYVIQEIKKKYPDVLFLSEAFTRPKIMNRLAKEGFTQSYTYFTWRNSKEEITQYINELTQTQLREYFRPNFWPNTPDINPWALQSKHEPVYAIKHFLAATLSGNYGIYGPVFEYMIGDAIPGKEEYLDSEKYEYKNWDWNKQNKLTHLISLINTVRKENPALQQTNNIQFCNIENEQILSYIKWNDSKDNFILCVVNLDPYYKQNGWVQVPLKLLEIAENQTFKVNDLITQTSYNWDKEWNYVELDPALPYHLFLIKK